jgi:hypothetical protein
MYALYRDLGEKSQLVGIYKTREEAERAKVYHAHELALERSLRGFINEYEECVYLFDVTEAKPEHAPSENDVLEILKKALDECDDDLPGDVIILVKNLIKDCKIPPEKVFTVITNHPNGQKYYHRILIGVLEYVPPKLTKKLLELTSI